MKSHKNLSTHISYKIQYKQQAFPILIAQKKKAKNKHFPYFKVVLLTFLYFIGEKVLSSRIVPIY